MALVYLDRVAEIVTIIGTDTFALSGVSPTGYRPFTLLSNGDTCYYHCNNRLTNEWEVGLGTYVTGSLTRDVILSSSNFNNKVNFTAANKDLSIVVPSKAVTDLITQASTDLASTLVWSYEVTGSAVSQVTATGLDCLAHKGYYVSAGIITSGTTATTVRLYCNGDTSSASYSGRYIRGSGTSISSVAETKASFGFTVTATAGLVDFGTCSVSMINGYPCWQGLVQNTNLTNGNIVWVKKIAQAANITELNFKAEAGTPIGVGSKFNIFKKGN